MTGIILHDISLKGKKRQKYLKFQNYRRDNYPRNPLPFFLKGINGLYDYAETSIINTFKFKWLIDLCKFKTRHRVDYRRL